MYFKRLELFGFKSFADRTTLNFEPGITAIVGPNGCGKSNIFDSIRWVLGEQSAKDLRGSSMEDVIFNGTEKKPSLGFSEVSLTLSNDSRKLPIEDDEVTVTRRLFRSGESEYLINKNIARLKDIQELMMGTGIGTESYSMIQQGRVDLVVNTRPEERRQIFDEAAGITKYKTKKKEALNKLKDTDDNLLRINDIIMEVKRQIASIERQANKARKYKDEFEKLKSLEVKLARYEIAGFIYEKNKISAQIQELKEKEAASNKEFESLSGLLNNEINYLSEIEQKINDVHSQEIKLDGQMDLDTRQIGFNQERIDNLTQTEQRLNEQKDQLIKRCRTQQEKIEELKQNVVILREMINYNQLVLKEKKETLILIEKSISEAHKKIREHDEKILQLTSSQIGVRNELTDVMKEMQGSLARKRRLELEQEKVTLEKSEIDQKLQNVEYQINTIRSLMNELDVVKESNSTVLSDLKAVLSQLEQQIDELDKKRLFFRSQKDFIEKLNVQYQDIPDPIVEGRFITTTAPLEHHSGIIGKVKSVLSMDRKRFELFKKDLPTANQQLYEVVCETKFIELDPQQISAKIDEISQKIAELLAQKEEANTKIDHQARSLQQIEKEILDKEKSVSILESQKNDVLQETQKLTGELDLVYLELDEVKEAIATIKKKEDALNYQLDTINQDLGWCQNDIKERQFWINAKSQEKEETTVAIAQLETAFESDQDKLKSLEDNLKVFSDTLDNWLEEIKTIDDERISQKSKQEKFNEEIDSLKKNIEKLKADKESLKNVVEEHKNQKTEVGQRINSARANMISVEEGIEKIKEDLHSLNLSEQQLIFNEKGIKDRLLQTYKINIDDLPATIEISGVTPVLIEGQPVESQIEIPLIENQTKDTQVPQPVPMSLEEMMEEAGRLRKRCESYGSVNLVAIEEFDELKGRFEFLTKQQADLLEAKSQLMSTIQKINRSTRQMFMDTFTKVSEEFRIYYRMLFGGGEAQLVLLDPENVLESGVEIVVRPPGKKLQSISLLSGGEKTLTAIALIFGIFKVNPSPFCVLDEIDAALDEANVGRFSFLLKDFSKIAQFIVITHNKKTIASSDVMYGITMPETGISRIVSVKFSDEKKREVTEEIEVAV